MPAGPGNESRAPRAAYPVRALIRRAALTHNLRRVRQLAPRSRVWAVIKADAYGHGALDVAQVLASADGFAVARVSEAVALRSAGVDIPICVLGGCHQEADWALCRSLHLQPVVHHRAQLEVAATVAACRVWVKIDTGMQRLGFPHTDLGEVLARLQCARVEVVGVMSHLANGDDPADDYTHTQTTRFREAIADFGVTASLANSAGVSIWPDTHLDWVRPGIMLYGASPVIGRSEQALDLIPAMTLESRLIAVRDLPAGEPVGYGGTWRSTRPTRLGIVGCGYGDGYPRHAPNGTPVLVGKRRVELVGRVSMDMLSVDLTDHPEIRVGEAVELWGTELSVTEVAERAGTISYELLCSVTARVPRVLIH